MNRNTFLHDIWVYLKCLGHGMYRRHFYGHQKPGHQKPGRLTSKQLLFSQLIPPLASTLVRRNNTITSWHMDVKKSHNCGMLFLLTASSMEKGGLNLDQWEFQEPKMEVLYHIRPYFEGIFPYIGLI